MSRVSCPKNIVFAIKAQEEGLDTWTSNLVYREVLLEQPKTNDLEELPMFSQDIISIEIDPFAPSDLDYEGPHDEILPETSEEQDTIFSPRRLKHRIQGAVESKSASQPKNVTVHPSLLEPLPPLPIPPQCEYERIRERNIREREEMWASLQ